jgi:osmotically-inducible protein OsmY
MFGKQFATSLAVAATVFASAGATAVLAQGRAQDAELAKSVQSTLMSDQNLTTHDFRVAARNGKVYVLGQVLSKTDEDEAIKAAKSVSGVSTVFDAISIVQADG